MKLLFLLLALPMIGFGQNVNIPDANFKAYLVGNTAINTNGDTEIQVSEASVFNSYIVVQTLNITDLTGIEAFVSLTGLYCSGNQLTSLDVSTCTALALLYCNDNQLTSLDVSTCTALYILRCSANNLTSLDVSPCTILSYLSCDDNQLTILNLSTCTVLTELYCNNNQLTSLNLSTCAALEILDCSNNQLTSLDVSNGIALTDLFCSANNLTSLDLSICTALTDLECYDNQLTSLDVSICTALTDLSCSNNNLTSLNVKNGNNINMDLYAITNPNLSCIEVDNVAWSNANWPNTIDATASFSLNCSGAGISDINESNTLMLYPNPAVSELNILGEGAFSYEISDMSGKIFFQGEVNESDKIRIAELNAGVYNITHITENKIQTLRFIKQ